MKDDCKKGKMRGDENGHIAVETVGAFVPFLLMVISILSLVNIVALQARVHYALTQAANTLSMYCYALEIVGVANDLSLIDSSANKVAVEANAIKSDVASVLDGLDSLSGLTGAMDGVGRVIDRVSGLGEEAAANPKASLQLLMNYGLDEVLSRLIEELARPLVGRYLANGGMTGDEYLIRAGAVNKKTGAEGLGALEFYQFGNLGLGNSELIDKDGNVKLVVAYEARYTFGGLPLPFGPTLRITQTAVTKAWLGGSGEGYLG